MAVAGKIIGVILKHVLPKVGGKVVAKLISNIVKNWAREKVEDLKHEVNNVVLNVDDLKRTVSNVPKIDEKGTDTIVSSQEKDITNNLTHFATELEVEPTSDDNNQASRELDSDKGASSHEDFDETVFMTLFGGIAGELITASVIKNHEEGKFELKNFDFDFVKNLDTDKYKERLAKKINMELTPDSSQVKTGQATGEQIAVLKKSTDFGDDGNVKNVYTANKAVIKRQGVGFAYRDDEVDSAKYDNPLNISNDLIIKEIGSVKIGYAGGYQNVEKKKLGFFRNVTGDELAVYTDPYYSFATAAQAIYNSQENQSIRNDLFRWIEIINGKRYENYLKRNNKYSDANYEYLINKYAANVGILMNKLGMSKKIEHVGTLRKKGDKLDILDVNTYISFLKVIAYMESRLDVSTKYLLACYNAQFYGMAKPLQIEGADWGNDMMGIFEDTPTEYASDAFNINQQAAAARQRLDWSVIFENKP